MKIHRNHSANSVFTSGPMMINFQRRRSYSLAYCFNEDLFNYVYFVVSKINFLVLFVFCTIAFLRKEQFQFMFLFNKKMMRIFKTTKQILSFHWTHSQYLIGLVC